MFELDKIPPVMVNKAKWAREQILRFPEKVEIDEDELLAWIFNEEDNLWYSIDGNYSYSSPKDKMRKRLEREAKMKEWEDKITNLSLEKSAEQIYYSKIRNRILERDNRSCQKCGQKIGRLEVHHIVKRVEARIDTDDNLITLCKKCHKLLDGKDYGVYKELED